METKKWYTQTNELGERSVEQRYSEFFSSPVQRKVETQATSALRELNNKAVKSLIRHS